MTMADIEGLIEGGTEAQTWADRKAAAFELARRSLRMWPVSREGDLRERTVEFMANELLVDQQHASGHQFEVKRVGLPRSKDRADGQPKDEVLLCFATRRDRDDVRSFARNLERKGRGVRLEVPNFRVLQSIAFELKKRTPTLKRNILFDDENSDLKMDICLNGTDWKTICPEGAREALAKVKPGGLGARAKLSAGELDGLLASNAMDQD